MNKYYLRNVVGVPMLDGSAKSIMDFFKEYCKGIAEFDYIILDVNLSIVGVIKNNNLVWRLI